MIEKTRTVYYCEHCGKHLLTRHAMERHERRCTLNPDRVCGFCDGGHDLKALAESFARRCKVIEDITSGGYVSWVPNVVDFTANDILDAVDGCPACALAVIRLARVPHGDSSEPLAPAWVQYDYDAAKHAWWASHREPCPAYA